jgi:hypothetical protein
LRVRPDAIEAALQLSRKFKYHKLTNIHATSLIAVKNPDKQVYKLQANIELDDQAVAERDSTIRTLCFSHKCTRNQRVRPRPNAEYIQTTAIC